MKRCKGVREGSREKMPAARRSEKYSYGAIKRFYSGEKKERDGKRKGSRKEKSLLPDDRK